MDVLHDLARADLIELGPPSDDAYHELPWPSRIELSARWPVIQSTLNLSLKELTQLGPDSIVVSPLFGRPKGPASAADVFMVMPFLAELQPVYEDHVKPVVEVRDLSVNRGDDFFSSHGVVNEVWGAINASRLVIADCTGRNPNVFYEIGLAHTLGRPVILITQDEADVPFDIRHLRYIAYEYTPRGMTRFEERLGLVIDGILRSD
jgi:hypothetical protein